MCPLPMKINPSCDTSNALIVIGKTNKKSKTQHKNNCSVAAGGEGVVKSLVNMVTNWEAVTSVHVRRNGSWE